MTTMQPLSLFISSKMAELAAERRAVQAALSSYRMKGWRWEDDAGARTEPIRSTYLSLVEECDLYLGLFWLGYGPYTIEEFDHARQLKKPCLVYEKYVTPERRSPELAAFLKNIQEVTNPSGLTVCRFTTPEQLAQAVQQDVQRLLTTTFRKSRQQPPAPAQSPKPTHKVNIRATKGGIAVYNNSGNINQHNYGNTEMDEPEDD